MITEDSLFIAGQKKRGGRPRVDPQQPLKPVTTWVPETYAERLDSLARKHDVSVSALVRQWLKFRIDRA